MSTRKAKVPSNIIVLNNGTMINLDLLPQIEHHVEDNCCFGVIIYYEVRIDKHQCYRFYKGNPEYKTISDYIKYKR